MHGVTQKKMLVTGAFGFIGRHLVRHVRADGTYKLAINFRHEPQHLPEWYPAEDIHLIPGDLNNAGTLDQIAGYAPDIVINLAGLVDFRTDQQTKVNLLSANVDTAVNLTSALPMDSLLIQVGSAEEYGDAIPPFHAHTAASPRSPYGRSKLAATEAVMSLSAKRKIPCKIARMFTVFGPGEDESRFLARMRHALAANIPLKLESPSSTRDFIPVDWAARDLLDLANDTTHENSIHNICCGNEQSLLALASAMSLRFPQLKIEKSTNNAAPQSRSWGRPYKHRNLEALMSEIARYIGDLA